MTKEEIFYADEIPYRRLPKLPSGACTCAKCYWWDYIPPGYHYCEREGFMSSSDDLPGCPRWEPMINEDQPLPEM